MAKKLTIKQSVEARQERMRLIAIKVATIALKKHDIFYSEDKKGDFANTLFFFDGKTRTFQGTVWNW